jgi:hypothetical protein
MIKVYRADNELTTRNQLVITHKSKGDKFRLRDQNDHKRSSVKINMAHENDQRGEYCA